MAGYNVYLSRYDSKTNPDAFFEIKPLENNGVNNESVPRPILDAFENNEQTFIVIEGTNDSRFTPNFEIKISQSFFSGIYTVGKMGARVENRNDGPVTIIPLSQRVDKNRLVQPLGVLSYQTPEVNTSLLLTGNAVPTYNKDMTWGNALLNNLVHIVENFANDLPPAAPLEGQLWYDTTNKLLKIFQGKKYPLIKINITQNSFLLETKEINLLAGNHIIVYGNTSFKLKAHKFTVEEILNKTSKTVEIKICEQLPKNMSADGFVYCLDDWKPLINPPVVETKIVKEEINFSKIENLINNELTQLYQQINDQTIKFENYTNNEIAKVFQQLNDQNIKIKNLFNNEFSKISQQVNELKNKRVISEKLTIPYDISLYIAEPVKTGFIAASALLVRDVLITEDHLVFALTPPLKESIYEIVKITKNEQQVIGSVTFAPLSKTGTVQITNPILNRGEVVVIRPIQPDPFICDVFITLSGKTSF